MIDEPEVSLHPQLLSILSDTFREASKRTQFWSEIQKLAKHNKSKPSNNPEEMNHIKPPSRYLTEIFETGKCRKSYNKPRDANKILKGQDILISAQVCPELKKFLNTIIGLCDNSKLIT